MNQILENGRSPMCCYSVTSFEPSKNPKSYTHEKTIVVDVIDGICCNGTGTECL